MKALSRILFVASFLVLSSLFAVLAQAQDLEPLVLSALEVTPQLEIKDGTIICNGQRQPQLWYQNNRYRALNGLSLLQSELKVLKTASKKLAKKKGKKAKKNLLATKKKIDARQKLVTKAKKRISACEKGQFGTVGGRTGMAAMSGLTLDGTNPAPNAQGEVIVSELPQSSVGVYQLQLTGAGFTEPQFLEVVVNGQRTLQLAHSVINSNTLQINIHSPLRADAEFSVIQSTSMGLIYSNSLAVKLVKDAGIGQIGDHVARLEHETPSGLSHYVIDANIPVPQGTLTEAQMQSGYSPFVLEQNGNYIPLQVAGITRYPNDEFDIVNVSAEVQTQAGSAMSGFNVYLGSTQLDAWPAPTQFAHQLVSESPLQIPAQLAAVFANAGGLIVEAEDVFGNPYRCDLTQNEQGAVKVFAYGPSKLVYRVFCMLTPLTPVGGANGTMPHLAGVFAYVNLFNNGEAAKVNFVVSNAIAGAPLHNGNQKAQALNDLYFKSLRVKAQAALQTKLSWKAFGSIDPSAQGTVTTIPLFPTRSDGKMHYLKTRRTASFEVVLHTPTSQGQAEGLALSEYQNVAFAAEGTSVTNAGLKLYSPHNIHTARMGIAAGMPWPSLNHLNPSAIRNSLQGAYTTLDSYVRTGKCHLNSKDVALTSGGFSQCGNKQRQYYCDYPYMGSGTVTNAFATLVPNPSNPTQCIPDPAVPAPVSPATDSPYGVPYGVQYGGMTSGSEIFIGGRGFDTWGSRSRAGIRQLVLYMTQRLQRQEFLHLLSGDRFSPVDALRQTAAGYYVPVRAFGGYDPNYCSSCDSLFGFASSPMNQNNYVSANNLAPAYKAHVDHQVEDEQHMIRATNSVYAVLQLGGLSHPRAIDEALALGYYSYFANPNLPQLYQGTSPQWSSGALQGLRKSQAGLGINQGRAFAHTQSARVMAAALDPNFKSFMQPYFQFYARDLMYWSQMATGLLHFSNNYSKNSVLGSCNTSVTRENAFLHVANQATIARVLDGVHVDHANELRAVISAMGGALLIPDLVVPQNSWNAPFSNVMFSHSSSSNSPFPDWNSVPANCKTDAFNGGPAAGEQDFMHAIADASSGNSGLWGQLKGYLQNNYSASSTLGKLQQIGLYQLQSTNEVMNLGYCQVMEASDPGYCG